MIVYYSGYGHSFAVPEIMFGVRGTLMLTYHKMQNGPDKRFQSLLREVDNPLNPKGIRSQEEMDQYPDPDNLPAGCTSHFLDSGSFSLWTAAEKFAKEYNCSEADYYDTDEFWNYMKGYAKFLKKYRRGIDYYSNVDVLPFRRSTRSPEHKVNAELSYRNLKWLEDKGLHPVPVVHYGAPPAVLQRYVDEGYKLVGLGGLVGSTAKQSGKNWIDDCFEQVCCGTADNTPAVDLHGFGVTSIKLMLKYPWYSVDSTTWTKVAAYGNILLPLRRNGKFLYHHTPTVVSVSKDSKNHDLNYNDKKSKALRKAVEAWLEEIDVPLGKMKGEEVVEFGVTTRHTERRVANLAFFERLVESMPEYPQPFVSKRSKGFGFL